MVTHFTTSSRTILRRPRITEKASFLADKQGVYCFEVSAGSSKADISKAIKEIYGVIPRKVHITMRPAKRVIRRGIPGKKVGIKKAYVYLKKGDKIEFV